MYLIGIPDLALNSADTTVNQFRKLEIQAANQHMFMQNAPKQIDLPRIRQSGHLKSLPAFESSKGIDTFGSSGNFRTISERIVGLFCTSSKLSKGVCKNVVITEDELLNTCGSLMAL
jgi:hypothetical protein